MRINIYAEELPTERAVERVSTIAKTGRTFFGARIFLQSPKSLHDDDFDDDRSAVTFWGPRDVVAALLRSAADAISAGIETTSSPCETKPLANMSSPCETKPLANTSSPCEPTNGAPLGPQEEVTALLRSAARKVVASLYPAPAPAIEPKIETKPRSWARNACIPCKSCARCVTCRLCRCQS